MSYIELEDLDTALPSTKDTVVVKIIEGWKKSSGKGLSPDHKCKSKHTSKHFDQSTELDLGAVTTDLPFLELTQVEKEVTKGNQAVLCYSLGTSSKGPKLNLDGAISVLNIIKKKISLM